MKNYKKHTFRAFSLLLTVCLTLAMVLSPMMAVPAFATDGGSAAVSSVKCDPGETVTMTVSIADFAEANAVGVSFTAEGLTLNAEKTVWLLEGGKLKDVDVDKNTAVWGTETAADLNGDILTLAFDVPADAAEDTVYTVNCKVKVEVEGALQTVEATGTCTVTNKFAIAFANMTLASSLAMNFAFPADGVEDWTGAYAEIVKTYADGRDNKVETIPMKDWGTATIGTKHYTISFNGIAAKEMTDEIHVTIYDADGKAISETWTDTVRDYATRILNGTSAKDKDKTMIVDMLNYGAAAQSFFGNYNSEDLANGQLTEEQKALATTEFKMEDGRVKGKNYMGTSLTLESKIQLNMAFNKGAKGMTAKIEYTDHYGKKKTLDAPVTVSGGVAVVEIGQLAVADAQQLVKVTVYTAKGAVHGTATDSVASYIARMADADALYEAILKFATGAYNSFH